MSTVIAPLDTPIRPRRRERRAERRRLKALDALSTRLAELSAMQVLLEHAIDVVGDGWIQGAWFAVETPGGVRTITAYDGRLATDHPIVGVCLVGAVVQAAGGPHSVRSQLVQRTLDLTWHAMHEDAQRPVQWCPRPGMRTMTMLELTCWNDAPGRTRDDIVGLLRTARRTADTQLTMCRARQAQLAAVGSRVEDRR